MRLNVVGLGTIGLPTALLFAMAGSDVVGIDTDRDRVERYRSGTHDRGLEPDVAELLDRMVRAGSLTFTSVPRAAAAHIVAVGTSIRNGRWTYPQWKPRRMASRRSRDLAVSSSSCRQ